MLEITEQLKKIRVLSRVDGRAVVLREVLADLRHRLAERDQAMAEKNGQVKAAQQRLQELEKTRINHEGEIQMLQGRLKEFESTLNKIKTNKEYQAALKEVADTKKEIAAQEDLVLQAMTEIEAHKKVAETVAAEGQTQGSHLEKERAEIEAQVVRDEAEFQVIEQERSGILSGLEPSLVEHYERIRKSRADPITLVGSGICQGCFRKIPPQLYNEVLQGKKIHSCPSCLRIIVLPEEDHVPTLKEGVSS